MAPQCGSANLVIQYFYNYCPTDTSEYYDDLTIALRLPPVPWFTNSPLITFRIPLPHLSPYSHNMFTEADIKGLLRTYPAAPPYIELLSGTGIITEATLRTEISQRILDSPHSPGRTSVFELGSDFSIEARVIERLLPAQQGDWARVGASTIITA